MSAWALQQAVYAALAASEAIKDVVDDPPRVFDQVPRGARFPYIVIGEDRQSDWSTATDKGSEHRRQRVTNLRQTLAFKGRLNGLCGNANVHGIAFAGCGDMEPCRLAGHQCRACYRFAKRLHDHRWEPRVSHSGLDA